MPPPTDVDVVEVETAAEMAGAVLKAAESADVVVMAAAVADYRPAAPLPVKLKKSGAPMTLELVPTLDILAEVGTRKKPGQVVVGFAAETASGTELVDLGRAKLASKGADLIVANDVTAEGAGFDHDTNVVTIFTREGRETPLPRMDKLDVAQRVLDEVLELRRAGHPTPASSKAH